MFKNRLHAGKILAKTIREESPLLERSVVLSLPRGGSVIGAVIASLLHLPHFPLIIKKISSPFQSELAIGAIGKSDQSLIINQDLVNRLGLSSNQFQEALAQSQKKVNQLEKELGDKTPLLLKGKAVIITDDGSATGATIIAAIREIKSQAAEKIIVALPVVSPEAAKKIKDEADQLIAVEQPEYFFSVSQFYEDFAPVKLSEVKRLFSLNKKERAQKETQR